MRDPFEKPWPGLATGGSPALTFANTLDWRLRERPVELFRTFSDLLRWGRSEGVLERTEARRLRAWAEKHPQAAARSLSAAIEIREAIAALFQASVRGEALPPVSLGRVEAACRAAWEARTLRASRGSVEWGWRDGGPGHDRPAWVAALDAARLLTSPEGLLVRQCGDAECGWFFLDTTRNRSRRWCSMKGCGNRNKARRFYRRSAARVRRGV